MKIIRSGDKELHPLERSVGGFKHLVDFSKVNLPKYNPYCIKLARHLEGLPISEMAKAAKMSFKKYSDIERGQVAPTEDEMNRISAAQTHVLRTFYEQWQETELDFDYHPARNKAIDYYQYKVFCDINKPRTMIAV